MECIVATLHIPEYDVRDLISLVTEPLHHFVVEAPTTNRLIDLHIGDNDYGLDHLVLRHAVRHCDIQNMKECDH